MLENVLDLAGQDYKVEFDVKMPVSERDAFLRKHKETGWEDVKGNSFIYYTRTMSLGTARDFHKSLPNYAEVIHVNLFPPGYNVTKVYSGPLEIPADSKKRVEILEMRLKKLKKEIEKIEETPIVVKLGMLSKIARKRN